MATLRDLGSDPSVVRTEEEMLAFADRQLGRNLRDLPFTLTYLFDDDGDARLAGSSGIAAGHPAAPALLTAGGAAVWPVDEAARGESVLVELDGAPFVGPADRGLARPAGAGAGGAAAAAGRRAERVPGGRAEPLPPARRGLPRLRRPGRRTHRRGHRQRPQLPGRAAAGRGARRAGPRQDHVLLQHQPRVPHPADADPRPGRRAARPRRSSTTQTREELDVVHRNGLRLAKLVNTLLDFSRIEAGRMQARFEPIDLAAVTAELASVFRSAIERAGLTLVVDCPPLAEPVYVDRDMWEKVVLNLLSNALKFTFDGAIAVGVRREDDEAVVTVADTGIGVPADEMPRLFERFHRVENARARSHEGSGIGLALVQELVGLHGGSITADSAEGDGHDLHRPPAARRRAPARRPCRRRPTRARRHPPVSPNRTCRRRCAGCPTTPTTADGTMRADTGEGHAGVGHPGAPARVLVADDNADMREYLVRLLRAPAIEVDAVTDGQQALDGDPRGGCRTWSSAT